MRGADGEIRAFHNVCAHRAHAVVSGDRGRCAKFLTCMYHGWTYHLDGRNRSVSAPDTFPKFDRSQYGLKPIELEVFMGMVFVRFRGGEPSVAERMAPHVGGTRALQDRPRWSRSTRPGPTRSRSTGRT